VAGQSVRPEHVIVDGASTDGTLEIVGGWTGHPVRVFSGPDQGMYDAMNKWVHTEARGGRVTRYWRAGEGSARLFYWGWMPPHPTFFVRRTVYERYGGFRLDMGSAADYELMLRVLVKQGVKAEYIPRVLVRMRVGGVSNATVGNRLRANRRDREAWRVNGLRPYPWTLWMKPLRKVPQWWTSKK
jgi:glycosyltransferase involved in cell wall biosynthesis